MKKIIIIITTIIIVAIITFTSVIQNSKKYDIVLKENLTCNFREEIFISDFIDTINGTLVDDALIDTTIVGTKNITITYKTNYGLILTKNFNIEVKDITPPTIVVNNPYIIEKESITNLVDSIFCADDYTDKINCNIVGEYNLNEVGEYPLTITATDSSNNKTSKSFTLKVIEKNKKTNVLNNDYTNFKSVYQKYKNNNTLIGLDLSKWQGEVNFSEIKKQGVSFVMLKIGGQTEINGEYMMDPKFIDNITKAIEHDLKVGIYFYSYANSTEEALKQAKWIISKIQDYNIELPIVFDWENWNKYTSFHLSFYSLNKIADTFMKEIEINGYKSMLYSSKYYLENIWYKDNYTNWLAYYTKNNDYQGNYYMWQVCNNGKINGIDGYVDIDILYLNKKDE